MKKERVLKILNSRKEDLRRYQVSSIYLFGSVARGEETSGSDIDLMVDFADPVGIFDFIRLKGFLETILDNTVDLVARDALKDSLRERILKETIRAA